MDEIANETPLIVVYRTQHFRRHVYIDARKRHYFVNIDVEVPDYISEETAENVATIIWNRRMVKRTYPWPTKLPIGHLKWVQMEYEILTQNHFYEFCYDAFAHNA